MTRISEVISKLCCNFVLLVEQSACLSHQLEYLMLFLTFFLQIYLTGFSLAHRPCISRDYGNGGTVCVCNITYCDTTPKLTKTLEREWIMYSSNKAGLRFDHSQGIFIPIGPPLEYKIVVDSTKHYQSIFGFGGAFTDSTGINIESLHSDLQEMLLKSYFSEDGIEYSLCRVPMGGTDFSPRAYSYDDGPPDPNLTNFKLEPEDFKYKIPFIRKALELSKNKLLLYASTWTAPVWMKTNHEYTGFGLLKSEYYQTWANYFLKFLEAYEEQGISFWGITTGNEPTQTFPFLNVVNWPPSLLGQWVGENLGPTLRNSKYSEIKIMTLDDVRPLLPWFFENMIRDTTSRQYIDGIGVHWYFDQEYAADLLTRTHKKFPEIFILNTEACIQISANASSIAPGNWSEGESYSRDIIQDLNNCVTGWVDWNMVLDTAAGPSYTTNRANAPIIVNATAGEFYKQPMFYNMGHFSKFVPKGSVRIHSEMNCPKNVHGVAFKRPDNGTIVVLLNRNSKIMWMNVVDKTRGTSRIKLSANSINTIMYG